MKRGKKPNATLDATTSQKMLVYILFSIYQEIKQKIDKLKM